MFVTIVGDLMTNIYLCKSNNKTSTVMYRMI